MNTTKLMMIGLSLLGLTACETGKSGAEISAIGESLVSTTESDGGPGAAATPLAIDYNARAAKNYTQAVAACQAESRSLCSKTQLADADHDGKLDYISGTPRTYWMTTEFTSGVGNTNAASYIAAYGASYTVISTASLRAFYCCL